MPSHLRFLLAEVEISGQRLGRHINHDPRSLAYTVPETVNPETVRWERRVPIFDQGNLGSCVGNATIGVLGTEPYYSSLPTEVTSKLDEVAAVALYSRATAIDPFPGTYKPTDTGTDGLSGAKAAKELGLISGYQHITSVAAAHSAIKVGPFMSGLSWMTGMDTPTSEGVVHATGTVRGGHEFEFAGYDATTGLWECKQSWGDWAKAGTFYLPDEDYAALLAQQGDATTFVALDQPAPVPTPVPTPSPTPLPVPADWVTWARHVLTLKGESHATQQVAREIIAAAGQ